MRSGSIGILLLIAGVVALVGTRVLNDRDDWILATAKLPLVAGESHTQEFAARTDGYAEIQIEVDESVASDIRNVYLTPTDSPSALDVRWQVREAGDVVAAGDARDYLYVEGVPSFLGRARRILMHVPYGRNDAHWKSFGLTGSRTIARGIGRFPTKAGERYEVSVAAQAGLADLAPSSPVLIVRADRRAWQSHYERVRVLGYLGLALIVASFLYVLRNRLRPSALPPQT